MPFDTAQKRYVPPPPLLGGGTYRLGGTETLERTTPNHHQCEGDIPTMTATGVFGPIDEWIAEQARIQECAYQERVAARRAHLAQLRRRARVLGLSVRRYSKSLFYLAMLDTGSPWGGSTGDLSVVEASLDALEASRP